MKLAILGSRGIPAHYGGFETFAERLALYLVSRGWEVTVYCQEQGAGKIIEDTWRGIRLVHIPVRQSGAFGTMVFDWKSIVHSSREKGVKLTLGYNTALFCLVYRIKGLPNLINMDGLEWRRPKWTFLQRLWLYVNEHAGCVVGNHLIADHPAIEEHLSTRVSRDKIAMIPYGADCVDRADGSLLEQYGLLPNKYVLIIARPEPENSILEMVAAFTQKKNGFKLVILGQFYPEQKTYHRLVMEAANEDVVFLGAIYDRPIVDALRVYARLYCHGHQVGGTNPSMLEAMGAGTPVLAHDNKFNRWVGGPDIHYFKDQREYSARLDALLDNEEELQRMRQESRRRHQERFQWDQTLAAYEKLFARWL